MSTYEETSSVVPHGEAIRSAVRYVAEFHLEWNLATVNYVSQKFDLTPLEEEFLLNQYVYHKGIGE